jgi:hypothetical protein
MEDTCPCHYDFLKSAKVMLHPGGCKAETDYERTPWLPGLAIALSSDRQRSANRHQLQRVTDIR